MTENLVCFLYTLMRDDVVPGRVEKMVMDGEAHPGPYAFSNKHLESYARELAERILGNTTTLTVESSDLKTIYHALGCLHPNNNAHKPLAALLAKLEVQLLEMEKK